MRARGEPPRADDCLPEVLRWVEAGEAEAVAERADPAAGAVSGSMALTASGSSKIPALIGPRPSFSSFSAEEVSRWKFRMNLPRFRATSGSLFGPNTSRATSMMSISSPTPMFPNNEPSSIRPRRRPRRSRENP